MKDEVVYPEALCKASWMVLFENGEVFPVKYFVSKDGKMLESSKGAHAIMVDGPGDRVFLVEIADAPLMALH